MKRSKRIISMFLAIVMVIGMTSVIPLSVSAGDTTPVIEITTKDNVVTAYDTLALAVEAIADGDTLKISAPLEIADMVTINKAGISFTIDGGNQEINFTGTALFAISIVGAKVNVTVKNLNLVSATAGIVLLPADDEANKSVLTISDSKIVANKGVAMNYLQYWDITADKLDASGSTNGLQAVAAVNEITDKGGHNNVVITNSDIKAANGYGVYSQLYSTLEITDSKITNTGNSGVQTITAYAAEQGSVVKLNNVELTSTTGYCVCTNPLNKVYINGGKYIASGKDACINVSGIYAFGEIKSGIFVNDKNCVVRAYRNDGAKQADKTTAYEYLTDGSDNATVDIYGGTFTLTSASGSAVRGGTGAQSGNVNIYGGTYINTQSGDPVINGVHAGNITNIYHGKFVNEGTAENVKAYVKTGTAGSESIDFPAGERVYDMTLIKTAEDFAAMNPAYEYTLANDITINATYEETFTGIFNGNGHTVTLTGNPLFKIFNGEAYDVTVAGIVEVASGNIGAFTIATADSSLFNGVINRATVNCNVDVSTKTEDARVGGIIGSVGTAGSPVFINCKNYGDITGPESTGGILGESQRTGTKFIGCVNYGTITSKCNDSGTAAGGIVGYNGTGVIYFDKCVNNGKIVALAYRAGGIEGDCRKGAIYTDCINNGEILAVNAGGGIVGYACDTGTTVAPAFINCTNNGNVTVLNSENLAAASAGGILGTTQSAGFGSNAGWGAIKFVKCVNNGNIEGGNQVGGIAGYVYGSGAKSYADIEYCVNNGNIKSTRFVSEILGYTNNPLTTIKNCIGIGELSSRNTEGYITRYCIFGCSSAAIAECTIENIFLVDGGKTEWYTWADFSTDDANAANRIPLATILGANLAGTAYKYNKYTDNTYTAFVEGGQDVENKYDVSNVKAVTRAETVDQALVDAANAAAGEVVFYLYNGKVYLNAHYTVKWVVEGVETTEVYEAGVTPEYNGTPTKASDANYSYEFEKWDTEIAPVSKDVTYTAVFKQTAKKYTIKWVVEGVETTEEYEAGATPSFKGTPTKAEDAKYTYTFDKWDKEVVAVTGDATYTATFKSTVKKFTVKWVVEGVETTEEYEAGATPSFKGTPTKAEDDKNTYAFDKWDKEVVAVTANATYTAVFKATAKPVITDPPTPSVTDEPTETKAPTESEKPIETKAPTEAPTQTNAPEPSATEKPAPAKKGCGSVAAVASILALFAGLSVAVIIKKK